MKAVLTYLKENTDWFDLYSEENSSTPLSFMNNRFYSVSDKFSSGTGIRVSKNGRIGFSYSNRKDMLMETARKAIELSSFSEESVYSPLPVDLPQREPVTFESFVFSPEEEMTGAAKAISLIRDSVDNVLVDLKISSGKGSRRIINSSGLDYTSEYSFYSASIGAEKVLDDKSRISVWDSVSSVRKISFTELCGNISKAHKDAEKSLKVEAAKMPVIFTPHAFSSLVSILLNQLTAVSHFKKISPFAGRLGEKVFSDKLTVLDDPFVDGSFYSFSLDDEGVPARRTELVSRGVLEGIISDLKYSSLLGIKPGGNASRGYSSMPSAGFSNIIISSGKSSVEQIMKSCGRGILVDQMIGLGQSNTITGDFSCSLSLAFLFDGGVISGRVKDCMLSGNIYDMLAQDIVLSEETKKSGNCESPYVMIPSGDISV